MERRKLFNDAVVTTRRKLFSSEKVSAPKRKKLFSEEENTNVVPSEVGKEVIVCQDCKKSYYYDGSTTNLVCPNCGGTRFNCVSEITDPVDISTKENPIDKVFSEKREQVYSDDSDKSKFTNTGECKELSEADKSSLTTESHEEDKTLYVCSDCDQEFAAQEDTPSNVVCPKCGGVRVQLQSQVSSTIGDNQTPSSEIGEFLKEHQGKSFDKDIIESELVECGISSEVGGVQGLVDAGYVTEQGEKEVAFSNVAELQYKLFSELVISISKEFSITPIQDKESAIESLSGRLSERCMSALKKANRVDEHRLETVNFSDKDYISDSGISNDLSAEYGGTNMKIKDFMDLLSNEYPDAPDNIVDLLVNDKVIKITGSQVEIKK